MSPAIRITLIFVSIILVGGIGLGLLLFKDSSPDTVQDTLPENEDVVPATTPTNSSISEDAPVIEPEANTTQQIRNVAIIFSERFESYNENAREAVLPSVQAYLTDASLVTLTREAEYLATQPNVEKPNVYTAQAFNVSIVDEQPARATVDVSLFVETSIGASIEVTSTEQRTRRYILIQENENWKIINAIF
ncbi:MAG: hypothetical protein WCV86_03980 [Patescibacteria group bacterium]|jgi:hypothetical protein